MPKALHCVDDFLIEARAAIKNQVARGRVIGKSFAKLLDNPGAVRMLRHMAVENSPSIMRNDKEAIQGARNASVGTVKIALGKTWKRGNRR